MKTEISENNQQIPQCQYFVQRKKRLCRMTVRPGKQYCGEHEPDPQTQEGQSDARIPCPYDPKHTCYISKLEKHLKICNARPGEIPDYISHNINSPEDLEICERIPLSEIPKETVQQVVNKINGLYERVIGEIEEISEQEIHEVILEDFLEKDRTESSRRHLRQVSCIMKMIENEGLVQDNTCYVELGAGRGQMSYYVCRAWCEDENSKSGALLLDRAAARHRREARVSAAQRLRADLAHVVLARAPPVAERTQFVAFAKHLCGVGTDYALRSVCASDVVDKAAGVVAAPCCHHRCLPGSLFGRETLQELGISDAELNIMLSISSWATSGHGRPRAALAPAPDPARARVGQRAKALLEHARAMRLASHGFKVKLVKFVPTHVSPENLAIIAVRQ